MSLSESSATILLPTECMVCHLQTPHSHPDLGLDDEMPRSAYAISGSSPNSRFLLCLSCQHPPFDLGIPNNGGLAHLRTHYPEGSYRRPQSRVSSMSEKRKAKATPPRTKKEATTRTKAARRKPSKQAKPDTNPEAITGEATAEPEASSKGATATPARTLDQIRAYRIQKGKSTKTKVAVWTRVLPRASVPKAMKAIGGKFSAWVVGAWKDRSDHPKEVEVEGPIAYRFVMFDPDVAEEIIAYEVAGGNFDAFLNAKLQAKLSA